MKHWIVITVVCLVLCGCLGNMAREEVLEPAVAAAWDHIKVDVEKAIALVEDDAQRSAAEADLAEFDSLLKSGDKEKLLLLHKKWLSLGALATAGIEARVASGEIHEIVGELKKERLRVFYLALLKFLRS